LKKQSKEKQAIMNTFGARLQQLRKVKNITQSQMSEKFDMSERGYRAYENNTSTPHYGTLISLADYFGVSLDYLVGRTDNPAVNE
jgi:transcriptional regulator with XRE-family HTH domain